jgi:hypothetical protein
MIYQDYGFSLQNDKLKHPDAPLFVGLECEIEGIKGHPKESIGFTIEQDGSLRNAGYEYISPAVTVPIANKMFTELHATIKTYPNLKFSNRTSIHVHANCANLDRVVVRNIILIYALFEEAFFLMVDADRRDNIHCVPLTETYLPDLYSTDLATMITKWHKYTALNIKPLPKQGTIEFRHMQGHDDVALLDAWLGAITNLFKVGSSLYIDINILNEENLHRIFDDIFGNTDIRDHWVLVRALMINSIIDIKLGM